jgi:hypothetical protein
MGKAGFWLPRTLSRAMSSRREDSPEPFHVQRDATDAGQAAEHGLRQRTGAGGGSSTTTLPQQVHRIGRTLIRQSEPSPATSRPESSGPESSEAGIPMNSLPTTTLRLQEPSTMPSSLR